MVQSSQRGMLIRLWNDCKRTGWEQLFQRQRDHVDGIPSLEEMDRCVDVGTAVLRGAEVVGGVVVAALGVALEAGLELEARFGRPVDRLGIEGMGQVDDGALVHGGRRIDAPAAEHRHDQNGSLPCDGFLLGRGGCAVISTR